MLVYKNMLENKSDIKKIKKLYKLSFPKCERNPFFILKFLCKKNKIKFYSIYEEDLFIGFCSTVEDNEYRFILYLAIEQKLKGKGYGSKIINHFTSNYLTCILIIEEVNKKYKNYIERKKRQNFYFKNNYIDTEYVIRYQKIDFNVLSNKKDINIYKLYKLIKSYSLNTIKIKIKKLPTIS